MTTPRRVQVLHLLPQFTRGGATEAAMRAVRLLTAAGPYAHEIVSLTPLVPTTTFPVATETMRFTEAPPPAALAAAIAAADLVHIHFWNTPALYAVLRTPWPAARVLLWADIAGHAAPQVVTPALMGWPDAFAATSAFTLDLPAVRAAAPPAGVHLIFPVPDFTQFEGRLPTPHAGFNIGYVGTVSFDKMHPDYMALHAAIEAPEAHFSVAGMGGEWPRLQQQAQQWGVADRFSFRGYVHDLPAHLSTLDVFGYPLAPDNYATSELILQEALYAGVPPVVFRHGAASRVVVHGHTGLVVDDAAGYRQAIEHLYHHPAERARLSANAMAYARQHFRSETLTASLLDAYAAVLALPKRLRTWPVAPAGPYPEAAAFVESLGDTVAAQTFALSLAGSAPEAALLAADAQIAAGSPLLLSAAAGGVLHYRRAYPADAVLRLWAGLALRGQGRPALAVAEFTQARRLGLTHWRVDWYLAQAAAACRADEVAQAALARVLAAAPGFAPAVTLAATRR